MADCFSPIGTNPRHLEIQKSYRDAFEYATPYLPFSRVSRVAGILATDEYFLPGGSA